VIQGASKGQEQRCQDLAFLNPQSLPAIASQLAQARRAGAIRNPKFKECLVVEELPRNLTLVVGDWITGNPC
jgi:hypothetical protein